MNTRLVAAAAVVALSLGAVACSSDDATKVKGSATSAAEAATSAAKDGADMAKEGADKAKEAGEAAGDKAANALEGMAEVTDAQGATVKIPAQAKALWEKMGGAKGHLGAITSVTDRNEGKEAIVETEGGQKIVYSKDTGAHIVQGMIAETWMSEGGLDAPVGLPTSDEQPVDNGWTQEFSNGSISWLSDDQGTFSATVS